MLILSKIIIKKRVYENGRTLRSLKNIIRCPSCSNDIADFLQNPQVICITSFQEIRQGGVIII
jgi:hypothetical protein